MDKELGGDWLPIRQAANQLGISVDTVRRRIQRNDIASRREQTPQGYRWLVRVEQKPAPVALKTGDRAETGGNDAPGSSETGEIAVHDASARTDSRDVLIETLRVELDRRAREVAELHAAIAAQARAIEATATRTALPTRTEPGESLHSIPPIPPPSASSGFWARLRRAISG